MFLLEKTLGPNKRLHLHMSSNPKIEKLITTLDKDIDESRNSAKQFLELFYMSLGAAVVLIFLYIAPEVAASKLPEAEADTRERIGAFNQEVQQWERKYGKKIEFLNGNQYKEKEKEKSGSLIASEIDAHKISYPSDSIHFEKFLRLVSKFQIAGGKLETLMKVLPFFISALCGAFLLTYRFHAQAANDLIKEKYKILAGNLRCGA